MNGLAARAATIVALAGLLAAQQPETATWRLLGRSGVATVRSGAGAAPVELHAGEARELPFVEAQVDFPWNDAGKPGSLGLTVAPGDEVVLAVEAAGPDATRERALDGEAMLETTRGDHRWALRTAALPDDEASDYRVVADVELGSGDDARAVGVVARRSDNGCYVFAVDPAAAVVRIERWFGADRMIVAQATTASAPTGSHRLTFQLQGFRLHCFVDEQPVLQVLDGGLQRGGVGLAAMREGDLGRSVRLGAPAAPRCSVAAVIGRGEATLVAATAALPGSMHVLDLAQARPGPPPVLGPEGVEPWLLQPPAAPHVMRADWRDSLGGNTIGEVPFYGSVTVALRWPALPALRHRVVSARLLLVTAEGDEVTGVLPVVPIRF
ncbi:MAG: hypothetical protein H6835_17655 [Planctomycetes bacterium]|nr:hypothetical protein [Planctomycetota bacterium]